MTAFWRQVGMNYIQYSRICGQAVRSVLKGNKGVEAEKRNTGIIRPTMWKDGKAVKNDA